MFTYAVPDFWLGMLLLAFFAVRSAVFPTGGFEDVGQQQARACSACSIRRTTWCCRRSR